MRFVIVTGMSGAGKSTALKVMEDAGYFCVDNLPVLLIDKFVELITMPNSELSKVAIGIDVRSGNGFNELEKALEEMKEQGCPYEILFLDTNKDILIKRFKETRRNHPLVTDGNVEQAILRERDRLAFLKKSADYIIDTSQLFTRELKAELDSIFVNNKKFNNLFITIDSFGFKYGVPMESDLVFDVRFLPNPYYLDDLKQKTGNDEEVQDYVMGFKEAGEFLDRLEDMLQFLIPHYILEGKNQLVVSIGCTGGKHRSVTLANKIYSRLRGKGSYGLRLEHKDIEKDNLRKKW